MPTKKKEMKVIKFNVECSKENDIWVADILNIPGLKIKAQTQEELKEKIRKAIANWTEIYKDCESLDEDNNLKFSPESIRWAIDSEKRLIS